MHTRRFFETECIGLCPVFKQSPLLFITDVSSSFIHCCTCPDIRLSDLHNDRFRLANSAALTYVVEHYNHRLKAAITQLQEEKFRMSSSMLTKFVPKLKDHHECEARTLKFQHQYIFDIRNTLKYNTMGQWLIVVPLTYNLNSH